MPICSESHLAAGRWEGKRTRFILVNVKAGDAGLGVEGRIRLLRSASHDQREAERSEAKSCHSMADPTAMSCMFEEVQLHRHTGSQRYRR